MTEPVGMHDPATVGVLATLVTAGLAWLGQRLVGKAAIQEAINRSFHELMEQLRQELRQALNERDVARCKVEELMATISALESRLGACQC